MKAFKKCPWTIHLASLFTIAAACPSITRAQQSQVMVADQKPIHSEFSGEQRQFEVLLRVEVDAIYEIETQGYTQTALSLVSSSESNEVSSLVRDPRDLTNDRLVGRLRPGRYRVMIKPRLFGSHGEFAIVARRVASRSVVTEPLRSEGKYFAVVFGVNDYSRLPDLNFATNDAADTAQILSEDYGFTFITLDGISEEPTPIINANASAMNEVLREILPRQVNHEDDKLLVFFAGHGDFDRSTREETSYIAPSDAARYGYANWLPVADVIESLRRLPCKHKLLILDSCFSGQLFTQSRDAAPPSRPSAGDPPSGRTRGEALSVEVAREQVARDNLEFYRRYPAFVGMSAGRSTPVTDGTEADQNSLFTKHLLKVLSEQGNSEREKHEFTFRLLAAQVEQRVAYAVQSYQIPDWGSIDVGEGDFVFIPTQINRTPFEQEQTQKLRKDLQDMEDILAGDRWPEAMLARIKQHSRWLVEDGESELAAYVEHYESEEQNDSSDNESGTDEEESETIDMKMAGVFAAILMRYKPDSAALDQLFASSAGFQAVPFYTRAIHGLDATENAITRLELLVNLDKPNESQSPWHIGTLLLSLGDLKEPWIEEDEERTAHLESIGEKFSSESPVVKAAMVLFTTHDDPYVHSCCQWFLQRTVGEKEVAGLISTLNRNEREASQTLRSGTHHATWYVDDSGLLMIAVESEGVLKIASRADEDETQNYPLPKYYAIAQHEITESELETRLEADSLPVQISHLAGAAPAREISFGRAQDYCDRLNADFPNPSPDEGRPASRSLWDVEVPDLAQIVGYRMPSAPEWIHAARGRLKGRPAFCFGDSYASEVADLFGWSGRTREDGPPSNWRIGQFYPSSLGIFDVHGGVQEWTLNFPNDGRGSTEANDRAVPGNQNFPGITGSTNRRIVYGGGFQMGIRPINDFQVFHTGSIAAIYLQNGLRICKSLSLNE